ncbi:MAG: TM2 domain-containing protein [Aphanocapsa sp. GSE-SYN-MK-11-07L]|jgi:TM2 domain-containing membrane protein YozV|nr:TM2 domain-containing protein [Aphanocapsa sp. GSE-SYN-MK-11-07L]
MSNGSSDTSGKKVAAGICGILLGWLGVHKFILGYTTEGILMLVISIIGGVVTCGIASLVMSIIGLVEGIIYLTKTDSEFYDAYITNKRGWF